MDNNIRRVLRFHRTYGVPIAQTPHIDNNEENDLRLSLLKEELGELEEALTNRDQVAVADALADLQVVLDGTFIQLGFWLAKDDLLAEVHRSNMSKLMPDGSVKRREDGKVLKGPNFSEPKLAHVLNQWFGVGPE